MSPVYHLDLLATDWQPAHHFPALITGEVHVWRLSLTAEREQVNQQASLLTKEELQRANVSYFERGRRERILTRATLRTLLGNYLKQPPEPLHLATGELGKPFLPEHPDLHFNVSHADGYALFAFTLNGPIGVDLEKIDARIEITSLVKRFFSRMERPCILGETPSQQAFAFFRAWTRKEAIIKATGNGLSTPLDQFGVSIALDQEVRVVHTDWQPTEAEQWSLHSFMVTDKLPGAVAIKEKVTEVKYLNWLLPG